MKIEKEHLAPLLIVILLLGFFMVAGYGLHLENKYNECVVEINELSNPKGTFPIPDRFLFDLSSKEVVIIDNSAMNVDGYKIFEPEEENEKAKR